MNETTNFTWHKIAAHFGDIQFGWNNIASVEVEGRKICIAKFEKKVFAFAHTCPHAGGFLSEGEIDMSGNLICPLHQYKFDMKNGRNISGEGYYLKHWPMEFRADGIYIGLDAETSSN